MPVTSVRQGRRAMRREPPRRHRGAALLWAIGTILVGYLVLCLWIEWQGRQEEIVHADAIVVLGAAQWNGRPSPVLQARLDRAIALYRQGYAPLLVLTGGSLPNDPYSEASVGREYALAEGIPAEAILLEEDSRTTAGNLQGAWALLAPRQAGAILLVSDPFHMARARWVARDVGFAVHPAPTRSSPISAEPLNEASYVAREALALLAYWVTGR